jgi:hypothetical protein
MIAPSRDVGANRLPAWPRKVADAPGQAGPAWRVLQLPRSHVPLVFLTFEFACQVALLFPALAGLRVFFRSAPFVACLMLLMLPAKTPDHHPARSTAVAIVVILAVSMLHPSTNSFMAGVATVLLNLAILSPLFWVPRLRLDAVSIRRLFLLMWAFQTASAATGVLQVYFPGRFEPATASVLTDDMLGGLKITLADGSRIFRPMGLTDAPGGAGIGGMYSVLFAMALWLERPRLLFRVVLLLSMGIGLFALYICQVRSLLVMLLPALVASIWSQLSELRVGRAVAIAAPVLATAVVALVFAMAVGGDAVSGRLNTLIAGDPRALYFSNRGIFLESTLTDLLPQYPLGAGLGRWGMMLNYFGDRYNAESRPVWAEIQWTAWLIDGGVPLMLAAATGMFLALREAFRAATSKAPALRRLSGLSGMLLGYSIGIVALTFSGCPFASTLGLDFWLLNTAVFAAVSQAKRLADGAGTPEGQGPRRSAVVRS